MSLARKLAAREAAKRSIGVGISGAGWLGSGLVDSILHTKGMETVALVDADVELAVSVLQREGRLDPASIRIVGSEAEANDAVAAGKVVVSADPAILAGIDRVEVVTDATPSPASGAATALPALERGKDVVLVNIEADVTVGRQLRRVARENNALYSVSSGDEPGCLSEMWDYFTALGYEPMVIGKGKNNPLDPAATPDTVAGSAARDNKDPYQVASYVDGTKTMFELTCVANATGCRPSQAGMTGPHADLSTIAETFRLKEDGGDLDFAPVVDYVQGSAMSGGVFLTVKAPSDRIAADLKYLKVGAGPYFTFFRPYHLWFLEAPLSIARAVIYRETTLVALDEPVAEVATVAKRDLSPGDSLDDYGGYTFRGLNMQAEELYRNNTLPVGLAPGARVVRTVKSGEFLTWEDVELDESSPLVRLRRAQDNIDLERLGMAKRSLA